MNEEEYQRRLREETLSGQMNQLRLAFQKLTDELTRPVTDMLDRWIKP